jgi:hypothetical protein
MDLSEIMKGLFHRGDKKADKEISPITESIEDTLIDEEEDEVDNTFGGRTVEDEISPTTEEEPQPDRETDYEGYIEKVFDKNNIHELLYDLVTDDHQLSYAMFYAAIFLDLKITNDNWRENFSPIVDSMESVIKFYKTRRDAPYFVRQKICIVLDSINWEEFSCKQDELVAHEYGYLLIEFLDFMEKLEKYRVVEEFYDFCYINYKQLTHISQLFDQDLIKTGLREKGLIGVTEVHFKNVEDEPKKQASKNDDNITKLEDDIKRFRSDLVKKTGYLETIVVSDFDDRIQWVADDIKRYRSDSDKSPRIHQRLYAERYKERLIVDEVIFDRLLEQFPHFHEVIDFYKAQFRLNALTGNKFIPPVLLLGAPGLGKTKFAKDFAAALKTGYTFVDVASMTTSFVLAGLSDSWNGSKHGKIIDAMINSPTASPVVVIDEIEKASPLNNSGDPRTPLFQLFEETTARAFTDEFVDYPVDVSSIIYVCCANSTEGLSEPLLTRLKVFTIEAPTSSQHAKILQSIYKGEIGSAKVFPDELPGNVIHALADKSLRSAKVLISDAIAKALLEISPEDMNELKANEGKLKIDLHHFALKQIQSKKIGF